MDCCQAERRKRNLLSYLTGLFWKKAVSRTAQLLFLSAVISGCDTCKDCIPGENANTSEELYINLIEAAITTDVEDIQGGGLSWQGYRIWLRFKASQDTIDRIISQGYEKESFPSGNNLICDPGEFHEKFTPDWEIEPCNEGYVLSGFENSWSHFAIHTLIISNGYVYFFGSGA